MIFARKLPGFGAGFDLVSQVREFDQSLRSGCSRGPRKPSIWARWYKLSGLSNSKRIKLNGSFFIFLDDKIINEDHKIYSFAKKSAYYNVYPFFLRISIHQNESRSNEKSLSCFVNSNDQVFEFSNSIPNIR